MDTASVSAQQGGLPPPPHLRITVGTEPEDNVGHGDGTGASPHTGWIAASPAPGFILVVDDNQAVRETIADLLDMAGFHPLQAADAAEAMTIIGSRSDIAVLVTDLSMPGADGICLIGQARCVCPDLPAILLTGYAEDVSAISASAGGKYHVLRKPVASELLIEKLNLLTGTHHPP